MAMSCLALWSLECPRRQFALNPYVSIILFPWPYGAGWFGKSQGCYQLLKAVVPAVTDLALVTTITTVVLQVPGFVSRAYSSLFKLVFLPLPTHPMGLRSLMLYPQAALRARAHPAHARREPVTDARRCELLA